jgi:hypothetical protein
MVFVMPSAVKVIVVVPAFNPFTTNDLLLAPGVALAIVPLLDVADAFSASVSALTMNCAFFFILFTSGTLSFR